MSEELENAFSETCEVVLGRSLPGKLDDYAPWLERYSGCAPVFRHSAVSGSRVQVAGYVPAGVEIERVASIEEAQELGKKALAPDAAEALRISNASSALKDIGIIALNTHIGVNIDIEQAAIYWHSSHCYRGTSYVHSKYCAYDHWPRNSECVFGSRTIFSSKYVLRSYYSSNLTRCMEMLDCNRCRDSYFCHNSENLDNCMFCFNTKSKRYAIGNVEVGRERYVEFKRAVLGEVADGLDAQKDSALSIYTLCGIQGAK